MYIYITCICVYMLKEEKSRVEIFREYARKSKQSVWSPFLNMLNRHDGFIINQVRHKLFIPSWRSWLSHHKVLKGNRRAVYIVHVRLLCDSPQTARIIAKLACWGKERMERSELHYYLTWLKDQLRAQVRHCCLNSNCECSLNFKHFDQPVHLAMYF